MHQDIKLGLVDHRFVKIRDAIASRKKVQKPLDIQVELINLILFLWLFSLYKASIRLTKVLEAVTPFCMYKSLPKRL